MFRNTREIDKYLYLKINQSIDITRLLSICEGTIGNITYLTD